MNKLIIKYVVILAFLLIAVPLTVNHINPWLGWVTAIVWAIITLNQILKDIKKLQ